MQRNPQRPAEYQVTDLGYNHRLSDLHAALGSAQLHRLEAKVAERQRLVERYDEAFFGSETIHWVRPLPNTQSAWHLASVLVPSSRRWSILEGLQAAGIGAANHYPPAHQQPTFVAFGPFSGLKSAEAYCARQITLPLYEGLSHADQDQVVRQLLSLAQP